jgi:RNA polymerase sigma factor (sigma-70 family)
MDDDGSTALTDGELVLLTRGGCVEAYALLFRRHVPVLRATARRFVRAADVDDVVAEAFATTLDQLRRGRGPTTSVRAYLLTAVRHEAGRRAARERRLVLVDDIETCGCVPDDVSVAFDHDDVGLAFRQLPVRWQRVLWQLEVEGRRPQDLADELGMTPNAVSALGMRARAGLRRAYAGQIEALGTAV